MNQYPSPTLESADPLTVLAEISHNTKIQAEYAKRQLFFTKLIFIAVVLLLVVAVISAVILIPKTVTMLDNITALSEQLAQFDIDTLSAELIETAEAIETITTQLEPTLENINAAVLSAQEDITVALEKLKSLDLETLNTAIRDLSAVIKPLASLFKR